MPLHKSTLLLHSVFYTTQFVCTTCVRLVFQWHTHGAALLQVPKVGRLETLSGGSKQSQSTSSKLRLTADSSGQIASSLQHVDSAADSHPRQTDSQPRSQ